MRQARGRGGAARAGGRGATPVSRASSTVASRDVTFKNSRGQVLVATLVDSEASGVVVLCHGFASTRNDFNYPAMAAALKARQLGSLRLDFSGNGQSQGTFSYGNYLQEVDDIRAAVNWLKAEGKEVVGLVGHSKAGNNVLIYSAMYDDVPYVVNIAGRFDVSGGIKERFGSDIHERLAREQSITIEQKAANGDEFTWELTKWSMEDRLKIDMKSYCERIKLAEVLTVHGTADTVVSPAEAQQFAKLIGTHELFMVQGAGHSFTDAAHAEALIQKVVSFVSG